ncbi:MAG: alpha/beta fold hydrolase [Pirellulales bacterium]|nr:alpha/beta fold hydrolase [Pirellulales bacterium]
MLRHQHLLRHQHFMYTPRFRLLHEPSSPVAEVVWINHAGGATNTLLHRVRALSPEHGLRILTPWMPAREELAQESYDGGLDDLAGQLAERIQQERSEQQERNERQERGQQGEAPPLVLVGHSFGSVIAYRMACLLSAQGTVVHRLVVLSFPSPENLYHEKQLHALDDQQLMEQVDKQFGAVPANLRDDPGALKFFIPAMRFDIGLLAGYVHQQDAPALTVPIVAICGTDDQAVDIADMQGWQQVTRAPFRLRSMPGDHFFPLQRMAEVLDVATWDVVPG